MQTAPRSNRVAREDLPRFVPPILLASAASTPPVEEGSALAQATAEQGLEGVVIKRLDALYLPGAEALCRTRSDDPLPTREEATRRDLRSLPHICPVGPGLLGPFWVPM